VLGSLYRGTLIAYYVNRAPIEWSKKEHRMKNYIKLLALAIVLASVAGVGLWQEAKAQSDIMGVESNKISQSVALQTVQNVTVRNAQAAFSYVYKHNARPNIQDAGPTTAQTGCPPGGSNPGSDHCLWICSGGGALDNLDADWPCTGTECCPGCGDPKHECP
jgi:hypothetical protein